MTSAATRHVYGPVPSRRLGRSLGIDLVPFKTCTYDCIYCQLGRTTCKTSRMKAYVPVAAVLDELARSLESGPPPDYIGLAGSGEPTLHSGIGEVIDGIRRLTPIPVAVLTNGSMLWSPEVRAALAQADLILPSLDAGNPQTFQRVNRPHPDIPFERLVNGLLAFAEGSRARIWLEVFVLRGVTDRPAEIAQIAAIVARIRPARVQLNTVCRPPAEPWALAVPVETLSRFQGAFPGVCDIAAARPWFDPVCHPAGTHPESRILALLGRRPCTVEGIASGLALHPSEVIKCLDGLHRCGAVDAVWSAGEIFYQRVDGPGCRAEQTGSASRQRS